MTDRESKFLALLERYAMTVARRECAVEYQELRATEALADEQRAELLAFIGERWIPVSEPPENHTVVIAYDAARQLVDECLYCDGWLFDYGEGYEVSVGSVITHWMPMPEPPEVKE